VFDRTAHVYDLLYATVKDYHAEATELAALIRERCPRATSLLDVACGTGRHLQELRSSFADIAGIDVEPGMLEVARGRLPDVRLELADMRAFELGRTFDAVTCLFSSVGYLSDLDDLTDAIARMREHVAPGGVLVVDGWIRPDAWWPGVNVHAYANDAAGVAVSRVSRTWREGSRTTLDMRYLIATADGFESLEEVHVLTLFADEEYRAAFAAAGLDAQVVPGPMGDDRDRYVAVAP